MIYIGVDAHKSFATFHPFDAETEPVLREADKVPTHPEAFAELLADSRWQVARAVLEASNISSFVAEILDAFVEQVVIADPKVVRQLIRFSRPKTDKVDAEELAWQLSRGLIHKVHQHRPSELAQRALSRGLRSVTANGTRLRNQIRALLGQFGLYCPASDLCGKAARQWLQSVELREPAQAALEAMTHLLFATQQQRERLQRQVKAAGRQHEQAKLLTTIPGIGPQTALTIVTEVGDIQRFGNHREFVNFRRSGKLVKGNRHLKLAFTQAGNCVAQQKGDTPIHQHYRRRVRELGRNQAKLETGRTIARTAHALLTRRVRYRYTS